jgi:6-pyruvoyl-tetrahydropterin synthase
MKVNSNITLGVQRNNTSTPAPKSIMMLFPAHTDNGVQTVTAILIHGYSFNEVLLWHRHLDVRNWAADYGGLKELKENLEDQFDHTLLVSADDPELETYKLLQQKKMAKLTICLD